MRRRWGIFRWGVGTQHPNLPQVNPLPCLETPHSPFLPISQGGSAQSKAKLGWQEPSEHPVGGRRLHAPLSCNTVLLWREPKSQHPPSQSGTRWPPRPHPCLQSAMHIGHPPRKPTPGTVPWVLVHRGGQGHPRRPGEKEREEGVKQLPSSRQEQVGAPQPGDGGSWDLLGMCQGCWLPCGEAVMCSQRTWDRGHSPALLWALAAQLPHLFQEDPEDPARCPGAGSSMGGAHGAGGH